MPVLHQVGNNKNKFLCKCDYCHKEFVCRTASCINFDRTFCADCLKNYDKEDYSPIRLYYPRLSLRVIQGQNDLYTKYPEVLKYIVKKDLAKTYSYGTRHKFETECPICKQHKIQNIRGLIAYKKYNCDFCDVDYMSYPNKFLRAFMKQLKVEKLEFEYSPSWITPNRYDCYFELQNQKYIVEMDGGLGHGNNTFNSDEKDVIGLQKDIYKDKKAKEHCIEVLRIDCLKSDKDYIKNNLTNSKLGKLFNLSIIDWDKCDEFALKNLVYEVCNFYKNATIDNKRTVVIANKFGLDITTVEKYLRLGTKAGFCFYDKALANKLRIAYSVKTNKEKARKIKTYFNKEFIGTFDMETLVDYLKKHTSTKGADHVIKERVREVCRGNGKRHSFFGYKFNYAIS